MGGRRQISAGLGIEKAKSAERVIRSELGSGEAMTVRALRAISFFLGFIALAGAGAHADASPLAPGSSFAAPADKARVIILKRSTPSNPVHCAELPRISWITSVSPRKST